MAVFVDNSRNPYGRMVMCHMIADTQTELLRMAATIGVRQCYIQYANTPKEHFDICLAKREQAVLHGALEIDKRKFVELIKKKRESEHVLAADDTAGGKRCQHI